MQIQGQARRYDLDWLRVIAFVLLMLFHTGMMFVSWDWHVKNPETSPVLEWCMRFLHEWRMPLLFFISGAAVWFAMEKYTFGTYMRERLARLLVPLVFGMLVIIPPQVYFERRFQGWAYASFWEFWPTIFTSGSYPQGNMSWHHLWYVPYIFTYSLLLLPILVLLRTPRGRRWMSSFRQTLSRPGALIFLCIPSAAVDLCLRPFWPADYNNLTSDWGNLASKAVLFLAGFILCSGDDVWEVIERNLVRHLWMGLAAFTLLNFCWYSDWPFGGIARQAYRVLRDFNLWCWLLALLGLGRRYLRVNHPFLKYATEAVYPWYILHQTVIVIIGFYVAPWNLGLWWKYLLVLAAMTVVTGSLYEFLIRRCVILRPFFGLKIKTRERRSQMPAPGCAAAEGRE